MRPIEISDFNAADEFVVEAMMQDGKFKVIGKVIIDNNLLNDDDLDKILPLLRQAIDELDKSESGSV